ncbi:hypothetical protein RRG08_027692 [Elysia crispata]|uniref:Uncharacterized protein n=1 Tax=Elysia crispata TaxID=231223 RepID=A0AAE0XMP8_9GAST|nr:hypothetical protein RRG08_027692 [Elysia crispata]
MQVSLSVRPIHCYSQARDRGHIPLRMLQAAGTGRGQMRAAPGGACPARESCRSCTCCCCPLRPWSVLHPLEKHFDAREDLCSFQNPRDFVFPSPSTRYKSRS